MAPADGRSPQERRIAVLEARLDDAGNQIDRLRLHALVWPAVVIAIAALAISLFGEFPGSGWSTIAGLAGHAHDANNTSVQVFAVIQVISLLGIVVGSLALLTGEPWTIRAVQVAAGMSLIAFIGLAITVMSSGGGGSIGDLGYEVSIRILLIPLAALVAIIASRAAGDLAD
ncbi:hypothetical protein BH10ACT11_BH10ACT11_07120 [soil metagenome]